MVMKRIAAVLMLAATTAAAEPNAALYELRERCGKRAEEVLKQWTQHGSASIQQSHYNSRLNKCFAIEDIHLSDPGSETMVLFDVNESKYYGGYHGRIDDPSWMKPFCRVREKECHSKTEWNELVKPYMEE
jgi:hypothetical protein